MKLIQERQHFWTCYLCYRKKLNNNDKHEGNGQSIITSCKAEMKKILPRAIEMGDGQVVVVSFDSINNVIEVCPSFEQSDGAFNFPDSNNDGTWKKTDPFPEKEVSIKVIEYKT